MHDAYDEQPIMAPRNRRGMRRWARPAPAALPADTDPRTAEMRKFYEAAHACPVHKWCNPMKHCPDRDTPPAGGITVVIGGGQ